ncbi:MAG: outer membrane protein assembly factor BamD [Bacteroidota bacterium]
MKYFWLILCVIVVFSSCSRKTEEQLYTEAQTAEGQKDFQTAIDRYQEIVSRFNTGKHAEEAQYRIALIYNNDIHDANKAVAAYRTFFYQFPTSKDAPSALFLIGFLYNNELHNIDSARIAYQTFLGKYPEHELAKSAQFELENLGKDPTAVLHNEILPKADEQANADKKNAR